MGFAVVAVQVTPVVPLITVDVMDTSTERAHISAVVLNLDEKSMADFSVGNLF